MGLRGLLASALAPAPRGSLHALLREHLGRDIESLPIITESFDPPDHPNVHLALEECLREQGRKAELHGISGGNEFPGINLARLVSSAGSSLLAGPAPAKGPVEYVNIVLDERLLACVQRGLYLVEDASQRYAVLLCGPIEMGFTRKVIVDLLAPTKEAAEALLSEIRRHVRERSVFRGRVLSFERDEQSGAARVKFHRLPAIERHQIILPPGVLDRIERQTMLFSQHGARLLAARRHLKRGILLHGPPGTGKTLTAMYLAAQMRDRTVLLLSGFDFGWLSQTCHMARTLAPSIVIMEDIDLIAEDRSRPGCVSPFLFELLNHMDGLSEDTDVVFLLTTNRPEILEPALAARPGRIDQAIELPLPDAESRGRLFALYGDGLEMAVDNLAALIDKTEGASAAFIRELLRKAALFAAQDGDGAIRVTDRHVEEALWEFTLGGTLNQTILGARLDPGVN